MNGFGLYEPIRGSAPQLAGFNITNPVATILSVAMMPRYSFSLMREPEIVEDAVVRTLTKVIAPMI